MRKTPCSLLPILAIVFLWMLSDGVFSPVNAAEEISPATKQSLQFILTDEEQRYLKEKKQITMCVDPDWMPLEKIEDGKHVGMTADYMALIRNILPIPLVMVPTKTWTESIDYAKARKCDIFSLAMPTPEREAYMDFTLPYLQIPLVMVARVDRPFVDDITAITDQKMGVVEGYAFGELLQARYPKMQMVKVKNVDTGLQQVAEGKLDGFIETLATAAYAIQKSFPTELKVAGKFDERWSLGVATRNDEPLLLSIFEKAIAALDQEEHQRILNRWISVKFEQGRDLKLLWQTLFFVGIGVALLLYRNFTLGRYTRQLKEQNEQILHQSQQLQQAERKLLFTQYAVDSCAFPILWVEKGKTLAETHIINANKAAVDLLGYSLDELCTLSMSSIDTKLTEESWQEGLLNESRQRNTPIRRTHKRKDGSILPVDIFVSSFDYHGVGYQFFFFLDVSRETALQEKLHRSMQMEMIGMMAGGVAHDLNNILSGIVTYPELLLMKIPEDSALRQPLEVIRDAGKRAAAVVADLLTMARGVAAVRENANLNTLIRSYLKSPEYHQMHAHHQEVECILDLDPDLLNISCSPVHVNKCLMNLITNATEAVGDKGHVWITTGNCFIDLPLKQVPFLEKGEYVMLSISDDGHGIGEDDLPHIFEPFYTKKVMGKSGTGLGLTVVWNSVQDHEGAITAENIQGRTVFTLYFPATRNEESAQKAEIQAIAHLQGNGELILIVDDEQQQRDIAEKLLTFLGYKVDCVESGEKAVQYVRVKKPDLILLDMIMEPGMNGRKTYEEISRIRPGQRVIVISGFSEDEEVKITRALGARALIKKPYTLRQIGLAVQDALS